MGIEGVVVGDGRAPVDYHDERTPIADRGQVLGRHQQDAVHLLPVGTGPCPLDHRELGHVTGIVPGPHGSFQTAWFPSS